MTTSKPAMTGASPLLRYPARDHRIFDVFRSDNEAARGRHTLSTLAHRVDRPLVRWIGWSPMAYLFQPRALDGRPLEPPIVLSTIGRTTGALRDTVVSAFATPGGWFVVGSNGGLRNESSWVLNLRANAACWVTWRRSRVGALAVELTGADYDEAWAELSVRHPVVAVYREKAAAHGRHLSIWRLDRRT